MAAMLATPQHRAWRAGIHAQGQQAPRSERLPLWAGNPPALIGSVPLFLIEKLALSRNLDGDSLLIKEEHKMAQIGRIIGPVTESLAQLADAMRRQGLVATWRNEQLAVCNPNGQRLGTMERAAVRPFGIATQAVHLVGTTEEGGFWAQQRAFNKPNDPGMWDTLMGGMVSAADTVPEALARETWEEAGLRLSDLQNLRHGGAITLHKPTHNTSDLGFLVERIDWYTATVPREVTPVNQDGEVEQFQCLSLEQLLQQLYAGAFTHEAAWIWDEALQHLLGSP
jgi:8-oxo-dGTP pyrophosphatase MutT (NUDIX family)